MLYPESLYLAIIVLTSIDVQKLYIVCQKSSWQRKGVNLPGQHHNNFVTPLLLFDNNYSLVLILTVLSGQTRTGKETSNQKMFAGSTFFQPASLTGLKKQRRAP